MTTTSNAPVTGGAVACDIARLRAIHVETERDHELRAQLQRLLQVDEGGNPTPFPVRFTANLETRGIALIEPAGGGKTTAVREVLRSFDALGVNQETGAPRILQMQVESPATQKSLGLAMLRALGIDQVNPRVKVWEIFGMIRKRIAVTGTTVLWLDEAHDVFLSRSAREIDDILKMLKGLMQGEAAVILILSGTERLSEITSYDPQVNRRFTKILPADLAIGADNGELEDLIRAYCDRVGLTFKPEGAVISRLIYGSRKRFGRAVETTINAIERALLDGDRELERQHFAEAWGMQEGCPWDQNVFVAPAWETIELDVQAHRFDEIRTRRQRSQLEKG